MKNYIFLKERFNENGETIYYAIEESKLETLKLSSTYGKFGQQITHEDAGDNLTLDTEEAAKKANEVEDGKGDYAVGDYVSAYDDSETFTAMLGTEGTTLNAEEVKGFNYWDGHNWASVIVQADTYDPEYEIIDDEKLVAELNNAIEEKEFESEGFGTKLYRAGGWLVEDNYCQGVWDSYRVQDYAEYEMIKVGSQI